MVIVKLMGGLGNQMFEYAAGRRLADFHKVELKLDHSWFNSIAPGDTVRRFELAAFNIKAETASPEEIARFTGCKLLSRYERALTGALPFLNCRHIYEKHYHFDPAILRLPADVYLDGYWQSPQYFQDVEEILRQEFTVRSEPDQANRSVIEKIAQTDSVSVHVRRGDYISNPATSTFHGICSLEYYSKAVEMISAAVHRPHFFIFSDDPAWARENLSSITPHTVIDQNGPDKAYEDMRLLSLCKHHIIANSSFSWWGAWLSTHPGKIVIAPRKWFKDPSIDTRDLVPEEWKEI